MSLKAICALYNMSRAVRRKWHFPDPQTIQPDGNIWRESRVSVSQKKTPGFIGAFNRSSLCSRSDTLHFFCVSLPIWPLSLPFPSGHFSGQEPSCASARRRCSLAARLVPSPYWV